jgi:2-polyprenyl-6-methoxyphenol hydroxylase-like FAD-dependent oxidoreductase
MSRAYVHVVIVGAGIGGLSAAIAITRAGYRVTIVERAPQLGEVSTPMVQRLIKANLRKCWRWHTSPPKLIAHP